MANHHLDYCTKPLLKNGSITENCTTLNDRLMQGHITCQKDDRFIYEAFEFESTIATEFNLVCDDKYKVNV